MKKKNHGFQLILKPLPDGTFGCELRADPPMDSKEKSYRKSNSISYLSGWHLGAAENFIKNTLKNNGYKISDFKLSRKTPFKLDESPGAKINLVFQAIKDLKKRTRMEDIILGIELMSREETLYWHSKIDQDKKIGSSNSLKALRILFGGE